VADDTTINLSWRGLVAGKAGCFERTWYGELSRRGVCLSPISGIYALRSILMIAAAGKAGCSVYFRGRNSILDASFLGIWLRSTYCKLSHGLAASECCC